MWRGLYSTAVNRIAIHTNLQNVKNFVYKYSSLPHVHDVCFCLLLTLLVSSKHTDTVHKAGH